MDINKENNIDQFKAVTGATLRAMAGRKELEKLKVHPRDEAENVALMARAATGRW